VRTNRAGSGIFPITGLNSAILIQKPEKTSGSSVLEGERNTPLIEFEGIRKCFVDRESNIWILSSSGVFGFNPVRQYFQSFTGYKSEGKLAIPYEPVLNLLETSRVKYG
jgi:hypothetical protein